MASWSKCSRTWSCALVMLVLNFIDYAKKLSSYILRNYNMAPNLQTFSSQKLSVQQNSLIPYVDSDYFRVSILSRNQCRLESSLRTDSHCGDLLNADVTGIASPIGFRLISFTLCIHLNKCVKVYCLRAPLLLTVEPIAFGCFHGQANSGFRLWRVAPEPSIACYLAFIAVQLHTSVPKHHADWTNGRHTSCFQITE